MAWMIHRDWFNFYEGKLDECLRNSSCTEEEAGRLLFDKEWFENATRNAESVMNACLEESSSTPIPRREWPHRGLRRENLKAFIKPRPLPCGPWTGQLLEKFREDPKKVLSLSKSIKDGLKDLGFDLGEDLTFACKICVIKKPQSFNEIKNIETRLLGSESKHPINMIFEPAIMEKVVEKAESAKINYQDEQIFAQGGKAVDD